MNKYEFPDIDSCISILGKLEIDKSTLDLNCQDWEYTIADERLLKKYIELYQSNQTSDLEKRVLGCFIIQSITNLLPNEISEIDVKKYLSLLVEDIEIHRGELEYWSNLEEDDEENWAYVTRYIRELVDA